jgi:hypothetical protein
MATLQQIDLATRLAGLVPPMSPLAVAAPAGAAPKPARKKKAAAAGKKKPKAKAGSKTKPKGGRVAKGKTTKKGGKTTAAAKPKAKVLVIHM